MKLRLILLLIPFLLLSSLAFAAEQAGDAEPITLHMADGQLISHPVRVFVPDHSISIDMNPELCLVRLPKRSGMADSYCLDNEAFKPIEIARDQTYQAKHLLRGTLLLFDLGKLSIPRHWTGIRVQPVLRWSPAATGKGETAKQPLEALSLQEVYLSSRVGTTLWTVAVLALAILIAFLLTRQSQYGFLGLFSSSDGVLSISLTQMALWTLGVGGLVLGFGLMRLRVPEIPETLVWLMGISTTTSVVGHWQSHIIQANLGGPVPATVPRQPRFSDLLLIHVDDYSGNRYASLAKAQLLFWTVIALVLFIVKSIQAGELWEVPDQLVFLMGVSQSGYLARKQQEVSESKPKPATPGAPNP